MAATLAAITLGQTDLAIRNGAVWVITQGRGTRERVGGPPLPPEACPVACCAYFGGMNVTLPSAKPRRPSK